MPETQKMNEGNPFLQSKSSGKDLMQRREKKEGHREPLESQLSALESKNDGHQIRTENYIRSETDFLEKRETSYVGCGRSRNVAVARPKPVNKTDPDPSAFEMVRSLTKTSMGNSRLPTSNSKSSSLKP